MKIYIYINDVIIDWFDKVLCALQVVQNESNQYSLTELFDHPKRKQLLYKAFCTPSLFFYGITLTDETQKLVKEMRKENFEFKVIIQEIESAAKLTWIQEAFGIQIEDVVTISCDDDINKFVVNENILIANPKDLTLRWEQAKGIVAGSFNSTFAIEDTLCFLHKLKPYMNNKR